MTLICLGDSLTYGFGIPRHRVWPSLLAKTTGMKVLNWGINGDTTGGMLARFQAHSAVSDARAAILMGGFNDLALGADMGVVKANMFALVQQCFSVRVKPVLGIPISASSLGGWDALLATVQMPPGFPVGTLALDKVGARNSAWLAAQILALHDAALAERIQAERRKMVEQVEEDAKTL